MANQSIYETLATMATKTSVPAMGKDENGKTILVDHTIPENLFPDDKTFESETGLIAWAEENDYTFPLLQMGLQSGLIDVRAIFKSCKKKDTWSPEYGQANVNAMEWKVVKRPAASMSDEDKAIVALSNLSAEKIAEIMEKMNS